MHNIAHKTDKHTGRFVWGYLNPRMRTEIYSEQTGICLFWCHLGKDESRWAMVFLKLLFDVRWSDLRISETRRRMKIFGNRGRAGKGCLRISQGEFRPNVVRVRMKYFHSFFHCDYKGNWKTTLKFLEDDDNILVISLLVVASLRSFQTIRNGGL